MIERINVNTDLINLDILRLAIEKTGLKLTEVAKRINISEKKLRNILEKKEKYITYKQLHKISQVLRIPYGYLFLKNLPQEQSIDIPDLRNLKDYKPLSDAFFEIYFDIKRKQEWLKQKRIKNEFPELDFVGKFSVNDSPIQIAKDINERLNIKESDFSKTDERTLLNFINKAEQVGILVFKNSVLINNTHVKLDPTEFRGFAIADKYAPTIFINGADNIKAQIFTLFHELAHIWIDRSGISDVDFDNENKIEKLCNSVAVEILMPEERIIKNWNKNLKPIENIKNISKKYGISILALSYRALNLNLITKDIQENIKKEIKLNELNENTKKETGGDYYKTFIIRNSRTFTKEVINSLISGEILYKEAVKLLNIQNLRTLHKLIKEAEIYEVLHWYKLFNWS